MYVFSCIKSRFPGKVKILPCYCQLNRRLFIPSPQVRYKLAPLVWRRLYRADRARYTGGAAASTPMAPWASAPGAPTSTLGRLLARAPPPLALMAAAALAVLR